MESIESVNGSTASFDAEQGMAGGAAITVTTKSGANEVHGFAFRYHDNQHLKSEPYFRARRFVKPKSIERIFNQGGLYFVW